MAGTKTPPPETDDPEILRVRECLARQECPVCGATHSTHGRPFRVIATHVSNAHGVDHHQLRELALVCESASICSPEHSARRAELARPESLPRSKPGQKHSLNTAAKANRRGWNGERNPNWRGGRRINTNGYVLVRVGRDHSMAYARGDVLEHRLVMSAAIGRPLTREEIVHHINGEKQDNRLANLMLFASHAEHLAHHDALRRAASAQTTLDLADSA